MGFEGLRDLVLTTNRAVFGVPATVVRPQPDIVPISATVIWVTEGLAQPLTDVGPRESSIQMREPFRVMALKVSEVPTVPRGTVIEAAQPGGTVRKWIVDGTELVTADERRVIVVPVE